MRGKILICVSAVLVGTGMSLSTGSGTASADIFTSIYKVADEVAPVLVKKFGLSSTEVRNAFVAQTTKLNPVTTETELNAIRTQWLTFERRAPNPGEVIPKNGGLPAAQKFVYEQANQLWCETTVSLIAYPDKSFWEVAVDQVEGQVLEMALGRPLAIHNQLVEVNEQLQQDCIAKRRQ